MAGNGSLDAKESGVDEKFTAAGKEKVGVGSGRHKAFELHCEIEELLELMDTEEVILNEPLVLRLFSSGNDDRYS